MERRQFLVAAASTAGAALALPKSLTAAQASSGANGRQLIDLRQYRFASAAKRDAYAELLSGAGVEAFKRLGVPTTGLFTLRAADNPKLKLTEDPADIWVVLFHDSFDSFLTFEPRLAEDTAYQEAGKAILYAPKTDPAFVRCDTHLLVSFSQHPRIVLPKNRSEQSLFELRTYESHTQERAANKVAMFDEGEIPLFAKSGMPGVFFGAALAGNDLPHLTYMVHHGTEEPQSHWGRFGPDPEWKKMQAVPKYKDNTGKIRNWFLRPMAGSQI